MGVKEDLEGLWEGTFDEYASGSPAEEEWAHQRSRHLPWTLQVIQDSGVPALEYRSPGGAEEAEGTRTLLLMAGFSEEQLALCVALHARQAANDGVSLRVIPFGEQKAWPQIRPKVGECLGRLDAAYPDLLPPQCQPVDPNSPADVFQKILGWLRESSGARVAIDSTGGKKPMDAGAAYAASFYGLPAYYLDFDEYHHTLRRPKPHTLRYRKLALPDAAFSLSSRRKVLTHLKDVQLDVARQEASQIRDSARGSGYFAEPDLQDLEELVCLLEKSVAWWRHDYGNAKLGGHGLHPIFSGASNLRDAVGKVERDPKLLFEYALDEYHRMCLLPQGHDRERVVAAVGLCEFIVRGLCRNLGVRRDWLNSAGALAQILRKGVVERDGEIKYEATEHALLKSIEEETYREKWGDWAKADDEGSWLWLRHKIAHMRSPLPEPIPAAVLRDYVPRFIELLGRFANGVALDVAASGNDKWVEWEERPTYQLESRVPWKAAEQNREVERWLRLIM
jgi:hypothetical protein